MNIAAKENYGITLTLKKERGMAGTKSQSSFQTPLPKRKYHIKPRRTRRLVHEENSPHEESLGKPINLEIEIGLDSSLEEVSPIDHSKQVIIRAGSMKMDEGGSSRSRSRTSSIKILGTNSYLKSQKENILKTPQIKIKNFAIAPSAVPDIKNKSLAITPKRESFRKIGWNSEKSESEIKVKKEKKSIKQLLGGNEGFQRFIRKDLKRGDRRGESKTRFQRNLSISSNGMDKERLVNKNKSLMKIEKKIKGIEPYWKMSRAKNNRIYERRVRMIGKSKEKFSSFLTSYSNFIYQVLTHLFRFQRVILSHLTTLQRLVRLTFPLRSPVPFSS